jgi:N-acetylglucosamine-6-phosphate deacetylase
MQLRGRSCRSGEFIELTIEGARIVARHSLAGAPAPAPALPKGGEDELWLAPGFIDLQINGYQGITYSHDSWTFGDTSPAGFATLAGHLAAAGTTSYCPTITTNHREGLMASLSGVAAAVAASDELAAGIAGIHLEGPYISSEDGARGAHLLNCVRDPDWDEFRRFQEAACGLIKIITLAPERTGALSFIEKAVETGVIVSIGHTAADSAQIAAAVTAGARLCTHLGNGSHAVLPRHPNYIWDQLANDQLCAGIIADGFHLPANALKAMMRAKGPERSVLVSDAVPLGGMPPGCYDNGRHEVLPSGSVVLAGTPYLAGAGFLLDHCIAYAMRCADLALRDVPATTSLNAARLLGLPRKGSLAVGADADIVQFKLPAAATADEGCAPGKLQIVRTVRAGATIYQAGA